MKVSIIGAGNIGSAIAYSLLFLDKVTEISLIDVIEKKLEGEFLDLSHAAISLNKAKITRSKSIEAATNSDIVIITAGKARNPGETREDLFEVNKPLVEKLVNESLTHSPNTKLIILTNPSSMIIKSICEAIDEDKIIHMENDLDTNRLKFFINQLTNIPVENINSYVYGGHGENMQIKFEDPLDDEAKSKLRNLVKNAGLKIVENKGYTCWGIAAQIYNKIKENG